MGISGISPIRIRSVPFAERDGASLDDRGDQVRGEGRLDLVVDRALPEPVRGELVGEDVEWRVPHVEGAVRLRRREADEVATADLEGRHRVADRLVGLRRERPDHSPETLELGPLVVRDAGEVLVDGSRDLHRSTSSPRTRPATRAPGTGSRSTR